jgi:very-short-patch-repair endonuclease
MQMLPIELVHLARTRHGVVAARELRQHGFDRSKAFRVARSGVLVRLFPETYAVASLVDPFTRAAAIQLRYPDLILERRAAAAVWGLDGFRPPPGSGEPMPLDLVRADGRRCRSLPARAAWVPPNEIVTHLGFRVTSASWTVADLSAAPGITPDLIELAIESAIRSGLTTDDAVRVLADSYGPRLRILQVALSRRHPGTPATESYAETRFLQEVVRPLGLEDPERQVPIFVAGRPEPYRADFVFRRRSGALDVEIDGLAWHGRDSDRDDRMRDHYLRVAGIQTLRLEADRVDRKPNSARAALRRELDLLELRHVPEDLRSADA